ncbi:MAG TPA: protein kinase [Thermoanaerobaculia bacterium]|nr:protein kinase [Thermoanaerobaculia bacterium]
MSSILVVEPEPRYSERIHAALGADGWRIRVENDPEQALRIASAERPDLVLLSAEVPGAESLASSFSRSAGGPGVIGLLSESASGTSTIGADDHLSKPFTDQELRQAVQRNAPAAASHRGNVMLTSADIFGDVLAEVEADSATPLTTPLTTPSASPAAPPPRPPRRDDDEINRKLEQTLSGVFGLGGEPKPKPPAAPGPTAAPPPVPARPAPPRRTETGDVDALLSRTLSTLELGRPRPTAPPPMREETAVRKVRNTGEIDFSALEQLARPNRRPEPPAAVQPPVPAPAPPPAPVEVVPPVVPIAPITPLVPEADLVVQPVPELSVPELPEPVIEAIPEPPDVPAWPPLPEPVGRSVMDAAATQRIQIPPLSAFDGLLAGEGDQGGERFGQYTLLDKIAAGGMAEVWKARMRGVEGFQKTVAIKKILPHMTDNSEFVGMFIDEAKLAAQLSHPNIVHIYDLGKIGRDYYIAMEYVDGKDLRSLMNAGRRRGVRLPLGLALFIAARLASALDYAHRKRDFEDREMGLVHRDVSPQNVLLSLEGDVKLCDFGIAKAVSKAGQTQMGALKGKLQYMSPEQAWGRAVSARSDLFSLGAVLYEMLTGERLFTGDTEISVLESVRQGQIRSTRQADPSIPAEVDEIVAKALAYDPQNRFASAGEMKQRIESVIHSLALSPDPTDLAAWVQQVLQEEPGSGDWSQPGAPAFVAPPEPEPKPEPEPGFAAPEWPADPVPEPQPAFPEVAAVAPVGEVHVEESAPRSRNVLYMVIAALIVLAILFFILRRPAAERPSEPTVSAPAAPAVKQPAPTAQAPAPVPAPVKAAPVLSQDEIEKMVKEEMARREASIRQKKEAELRKYQKELDRLQADARKRKEAADAAAAEGEEPPPP